MLMQRYRPDQVNIYQDAIDKDKRFNKLVKKIAHQTLVQLQNSGASDINEYEFSSSSDGEAPVKHDKDLAKRNPARKGLTSSDYIQRLNRIKNTKDRGTLCSIMESIAQ